MSKLGDAVDQDWLTVACLINCPSRETLRDLEGTAAEEIKLDHIVTRAVEHRPGEIENLNYRLGDYFDRIELSREEPKSRLRLTFHARQDADSRWKDLLMAVLRSIGRSASGVSVEFPRQSR